MRYWVLVLALVACGPEQKIFMSEGRWQPGYVGPGVEVSGVLPNPGALTGSPCIAGVLSPAPTTGFYVQCIAIKDACQLSIRNQEANGFTFGEAMFYCTVLNP